MLHRPSSAEPESQLGRFDRVPDGLVGIGRFGLAEQDRIGPIGVIAVVAVAGVGDDEFQFSDARQIDAYALAGVSDRMTPLLNSSRPSPSTLKMTLAAFM